MIHIEERYDIYICFHVVERGKS